MSKMQGTQGQLGEGEKMSSYWLHTCGHSSMRGPFDPDESTPINTICLQCRNSRIGQIISFVRYGDIPSVGKSYNHRDETTEDGVSVYEIINGIPLYVGWYFEIIDRPCLYGTGRIVGWGSDGEPLVDVLTIEG